jgi:hypothetical protein
MLDSATWGAFALTFTVLGGIGTWLAYRRRGLRSGLRWAAATLLVPAAYFTRTLKMFGRIGSAIADWASSFVWNPAVWLGLALAALSVVLFVVASRLPGREPSRKKAVPAGQRTPSVPASSGVDSEMAEIEALLKRRGIS